MVTKVVLQVASKWPYWWSGEAQGVWSLLELRTAIFFHIGTIYKTYESLVFFFRVLGPDPHIRLGWAAEAAGSEQPSGSQGPEILRIAAKIARRHSKVKLFEKH